jgi:hypothetical protein
MNGSGRKPLPEATEFCPASAFATTCCDLADVPRSDSRCVNYWRCPARLTWPFTALAVHGRKSSHHGEIGR